MDRRSRWTRAARSRAGSVGVDVPVIVDHPEGRRRSREGCDILGRLDGSVSRLRGRCWQRDRPRHRVAEGRLNVPFSRLHPVAPVRHYRIGDDPRENAAMGFRDLQGVPARQRVSGSTANSST